MTEKAKELLNILRDESNCNVLDYIDEAADLIESLAAELEQVKRERDVAIKQMLEHDVNNPLRCSFCKHDDACDAPFSICGYCRPSCPCNSCINHSNWEWRGAKE